MSEELLLRHCSPTVIGLKTANMFVCRFDSKEQECSTLQRLNKKLCSKGLRIIPLRHNEDKVLLYLYRPSKLKRDLKDTQADKLLQSCGYSCGNIHLRENEDLPHEIALFLGYPPEDVCGFIENKAQCCKCVGCWKVYGDAEKAQATFEKYKRCTELCCSLAAKGVSIEKLAACY